jgi:hypothetical protein
MAGQKKQYQDNCKYCDCKGYVDNESIDENDFNIKVCPKCEGQRKPPIEEYDDFGDSYNPLGYRY